MAITVYSTHCPQCKVLEKKLELAGFEFTICDDMDKIVAAGMKSAPGLQIDDNPVMNFKEAINWIKENSNG